MAALHNTATPKITKSGCNTRLHHQADGNTAGRARTLCRADRRLQARLVLQADPFSRIEEKMPEPDNQRLISTIERYFLPISIVADFIAIVVSLSTDAPTVIYVAASLAALFSILSFGYYLRQGARNFAIIGAALLVISAVTIAVEMASSRVPTEKEGPKQGLVRMFDSVANSPNSEAIDTLLEKYFSAINNHDYGAWAATVTPGMIGALPEETWRQSYQTTQITEALVTSLDAAGDSAAITVSYTSEQDPRDAPEDLQVSRICWTTRFTIESLSAGGLLDALSSGASRKACQ